MRPFLYEIQIFFTVLTICLSFDVCSHFNMSHYVKLAEGHSKALSSSSSKKLKIINANGVLRGKCFEIDFKIQQFVSKWTSYCHITSSGKVRLRRWLLPLPQFSGRGHCSLVSITIHDCLSHVSQTCSPSPPLSQLRFADPVFLCPRWSSSQIRLSPDIQRILSLLHIVSRPASDILTFPPSFPAGRSLAQRKLHNKSYHQITTLHLHQAV